MNNHNTALYLFDIRDLFMLSKKEHKVLLLAGATAANWTVAK